MEEAEKRPRSTTAGLESKSDNFGNRPRCVECIYFRKVSEVTGNCSRFKIPVDIEDCCVENDS